MNKKTANWVYLFDKYKITEKEAEDYVTKDPDLSSSELSKNDEINYYLLNYHVEEAMFRDCLEFEREEQNRLLGGDPSDFFGNDEEPWNLIDENDPEHRALVEKLIKTGPLMAEADPPPVYVEDENKTKEREAYENETSFLEENQTSDYIRSCHQDTTEDKSGNV